jgi:hypothetical protein
MAKSPSEKKPDPAKPVEIRVLPMELGIGDRLTDPSGEWEIISRPYADNGREACERARAEGRGA